MTREEKITSLKHLFMGGTSFEEVLKEAMDFADEHPHWISVEDELPPMRDEDGLSDIVLTHSKGGGIYINRYNYGYNTWDNVYVFNVTHWMPMPSIEGLKKGGEE